VRLLVDSEHPDHVGLLESWMKSYKPEELFDEALMPELTELAPNAHRCQSPRERRHPVA
jgi:xylulose-5-phosphate/fructose-6-phosphate phosphoketolase